ncbi:uncharacterized protein LOC105863333 [Microcebus murinus]|uniref:uncharacterized protein LOC105863333 n=1 Tax=Microcebus murinus TaxID=30608 RepID=UPI003F6BFC67
MGKPGLTPKSPKSLDPGPFHHPTVSADTFNLHSGGLRHLEVPDGSSSIGWVTEAPLTISRGDDCISNTNVDVSSEAVIEGLSLLPPVFLQQNKDCNKHGVRETGSRRQGNPSEWSDSQNPVTFTQDKSLRHSGGQTELDLGARIRVPPPGSLRPSSLDSAGARGRSGFPWILDRARLSAEPGTGRGTGPARAAAEAGSPRPRGLRGRVRGRGWLPAAATGGSPGFPPAVAAPRRHLSTLLLSPPPLAGPGSAGGGREDAGPACGEPISCQASCGAARGLREAHKEHGGRRRRKAVADSVLQLRSGWVRGRGDNAAGSAPRVSECGAPALPRPQLDRLPARPAPSSRGRGAPSLRRPEKEVGPRPPSPATREPGKVCGASAGRHGLARPSRPRSPRVTFSTRRQLGPQRGRLGLRGGPESLRGLRHPVLRPW